MKIDIGQLAFVDMRLREIADWIEKETGLEFTVTSLYRINDKGVHGQLPCRGIDLRMRDMFIGKEIERTINDEYIYDPNRPEMKCAILHGEGANLHLHLQTHPHTRVR